MKLFLVGLSLILLGSCAFHKGDIVSNIPNEPVQHKDLAIGVSSTVKVFGIGSTNKDALVQEAYQRMIRNRPLVDDEAYNNITTDVKTTLIFCVSKQKVTITADIIAPKENVTDSTYTAKYINRIKQVHSVYDSLYQVGDSVMSRSGNYGVIIGFEGEEGNRIKISYSRSKGGSKSVTVRPRNVFVLASNYRGKRKVRTEHGIGPLIAFGIKGDLYQGANDVFYFRHKD